MNIQEKKHHLNKNFLCKKRSTEQKSYQFLEERNPTQAPGKQAEPHRNPTCCLKEQ